MSATTVANRAFRREKRSQMRVVRESLRDLVEDSEALPNGVSRQIKQAIRNIEKAHQELVPYWEND